MAVTSGLTSASSTLHNLTALERYAVGGAPTTDASPGLLVLSSDLGAFGAKKRDIERSHRDNQAQFRVSSHGAS